MTSPQDKFSGKRRGPQAGTLLPGRYAAPPYTGLRDPVTRSRQHFSAVLWCCAGSEQRKRGACEHAVAPGCVKPPYPSSKITLSSRAAASPRRASSGRYLVASLLIAGDEGGRVCGFLRLLFELQRSCDRRDPDRAIALAEVN